MSSPDSVWSRLHDAFAAYCAAAPWSAMGDREMFGVRDPVSGEVGYCCVMGGNAELMGLAVYRGDRGFELFRATCRDEIDPADAHGIQSTLLAARVDREDLSKPELQAIKQLGRKYRGRGAWPQFQSMRPGFVPWAVDEAEGCFLVECLGQALEVFDSWRANPSVFDSDSDDVLVRTRRADGTWDARLESAPPRTVLSDPRVDQMRLMRLRESVKLGGALWEVDLFPVAMAVKEDFDRPFFPSAAMIVDSESGMILSADLGGPDEGPEYLLESVLSFCEAQQMLPRAFAVKRASAAAALREAAGLLGTELVQAPFLPMISQVRASMAAHFG